MRGFTRLGWIALVSLLLLPSAAFAQASIAGIVKDGSGAVLPGVTVEASSPALIEKTRAGVTDSGGKYRIESRSFCQRSNVRQSLPFLAPTICTSRLELTALGSTIVEKKQASPTRQP